MIKQEHLINQKGDRGSMMMHYITIETETFSKTL